jgi:hypothetical protein
LIPAMLQWRATGLSIGQIAMKLADNGATTEHGDRIGPMLVHRILKRAMAESR